MNKQAMLAGRQKALEERRQHSIQRVVMYERWLKAGSALRLIPAIPTDADYAQARAAGKVTR